MLLTLPAEAKQLSKRMKSVLTMPSEEYCNVGNM